MRDCALLVEGMSLNKVLVKFVSGSEGKYDRVKMLKVKSVMGLISSDLHDESLYMYLLLLLIIIL